MAFRHIQGEVFQPRGVLIMVAPRFQIDATRLEFELAMRSGKESMAIDLAYDMNLKSMHMSLRTVNFANGGL